MTYYRLEGHTPVPCTMEEFAMSMEDPLCRVVSNTMVEEIRISTVFLGLDHNYGEGPPILFETMIFGGAHDQYQERYCTWEEAEEGHKVAVKLVEDTIKTFQPVDILKGYNDELAKRINLNLN